MKTHRDHRTEPPHWDCYWLPKLSRRLKKSLKKQVLRRDRSTDFVRASGRKWHTRDVRLKSLLRITTRKGAKRWVVVSSSLIAS